MSQAPRNFALDNQHLLRVRVPTWMFDELQEIAEAKTLECGERQTVSDLVRAACHDEIRKWRALNNLLVGGELPELDDAVKFEVRPMLEKVKK